MSSKLHAYIQLVRLDKPVGIELLLYPTLWAVFLSAYGQGRLPDLKTLVIFALGVLLMRSAGCAINDFADRNVDGQVTRTKGRPLADGRLTAKEALGAFIVLVLLSACLLFFLPLEVFYWSFGAIFLAFIYPFMKRYTHLPQVFLAMAFGWALPMAYVAVQGHTDIWCWLLFLAFMCWTVAYDTQYAMADRPDDIKAGIKSTAILFGRFDVLIISLLQVAFLGLMGVVFWHYFASTNVGILPIFALGLVAMLFAKQKKACATREPMACFKAFLDNVWVGRYVFLVVAVSCLFALLSY